MAASSMSCSFVVHPASAPVIVLVLLAGACATTATSSSAGVALPATDPTHGSAREPGDSDPASAEGDPSRWLTDADDALAREQPARAATLYARYLGYAALGDTGADTAKAYRGLARAHEQLGDFEAAIRAYDGFTARFPADSDMPEVLARRGACEAEIGAWERSAATFDQVLEAGGDSLIPSQRIEALARRGYALFQLDRYDDAEVAFARADAIFEAAVASNEERFSDTYFIGLARFYRAAIVHLEFREVQIRLPEAQLAKDFAHKLELLELAQDRYNQVVRTKHIYWVSAAGYQLGSLFEEFHDAVMYAPVPDWLDDDQRRTYYRELEQQLRPVIEKAIWVFEKNLETARKLGYESEFIDRTEAQLAQLQAILARA